MKVVERTNPQTILKQCELYGLTTAALASGLAVHPKTIERWREGGVDPNEAGRRRLEKLGAILRLAAGLLKPEACREWFHSPNQTLGGDRPLDVLSRGELDQVRNVLGLWQWGIYS